MSYRSTSSILAAVLALAACTSEPGTILNRVTLQADEFFTTGARQRVVTNSEIGPNSAPGIADPLRLVCTEPSPDVAIAVANSFATGLSIFGQGAGSVSGSQVEAMAQLVERTASIQLLRDKMYQTCLAYSNGAINGTTYTLVMTRLDDTIVSLLLGETAGGAFGRSLAGLSTEAEAESSAKLVGLPAGLEGLEGASNELALAQKNVDEKAQALRAAEAKAAAKDPTPQEDKDAVVSAKTELADAKVERDRILNALKSEAETMAETLGRSSAVAGGGLSERTSPLIAETLAQMQEEFLNNDFTNFFVSACLIEMGLARGKFDADAMKPLAKKLTEQDDVAKAAVAAIAEQTPLRNASRLADFCEINLAAYMQTARTQFVTLETKRLETRLELAKAADERAKATEQSERAKAEAAKARALAEFVKALAACNAISDAELKKVCISKLPAS